MYFSYFVYLKGILLSLESFVYRDPEYSCAWLMPSTTSHTLNRLPFTNTQDPYHSDSGIGSLIYRRTNLFLGEIRSNWYSMVMGNFSGSLGAFSISGEPIPLSEWYGSCVFVNGKRFKVWEVVDGIYGGSKIKIRRSWTSRRWIIWYFEL